MLLVRKKNASVSPEANPRTFTTLHCQLPSLGYAFSSVKPPKNTMMRKERLSVIDLILIRLRYFLCQKSVKRIYRSCREESWIMFS
jgi:hypothetical protein